MSRSKLSTSERREIYLQKILKPFIDKIHQELGEAEISITPFVASLTHCYVRNVRSLIRDTKEHHQEFFDNIKSLTREEYYSYVINRPRTSPYTNIVYTSCLIKDILSGDIPLERICEGGVIISVFKEIIETAKNESIEAAKECAERYEVPKKRIFGISLKQILNLPEELRCNISLPESPMNQIEYGKFLEILRNNLDIIVENTKEPILSLFRVGGAKHAPLQDATNKANEAKQEFGSWTKKVGGSSKSISFAVETDSAAAGKR